MTTAVRSSVTLYAIEVTTGRILTGRLVRLACERHLRDVETGYLRGLTFDDAKAQRAIDFVRILIPTLQLWQEFIIGSLFGWLDDTGYRRFRVAYVEAGKGSGKSPLAAAIGLYMLVADNEDEAEIYAAAPTREQAYITFRDATNMIGGSQTLAKLLKVLTFNISHERTHSFFRPVSSEGRALDGKRVHCALLDEIHEHPNNVVVEKMRAGTKGRRQALIFEITNSGYDRNTVCFDHHQLSANILEGIIDNDAWFAYVCQLDPCEKCQHEGKVSPSEGCKDCDDWTDESVWLKANPNIGVSIPLKYLREQVAEAIGMPSKQNIVKRLNFCIWTESSERWLPMEAWDQGNVPLRDLTGRRNFVGMDLSSTNDLTAVLQVFPDEDGSLDVLCDFFVPDEKILERSRRDGVPYDLWRDQKFITVTPGNVVDYDFIHERLRAIDAEHPIDQIRTDSWNARHLITQLMNDGFEVVEVRQGFPTLTGPSKHLEKLVAEGKVRHNGNPVLRWCISNMVIELDAAGNIKPSKSKSTERIDGGAALVDALDGIIREPEEEESEVFFA